MLRFTHFLRVLDVRQIACVKNMTNIMSVIIIIINAKNTVYRSHHFVPIIILIFREATLKHRKDCETALLARRGFIKSQPLLSVSDCTSCLHFLHCVHCLHYVHWLHWVYCLHCQHGLHCQNCQ